MVNNTKFFELFGPPCRNALADVDGSTPECAQVCAIHIETHLATLIKIESSFLQTNEITPIFWVFNSPTPQGGWTPEGVGHVGRHCPYTNKIWCGSAHALLRYRSKTAKMQKFPVDSRSNENFISPFFSPAGGRQPPKGEKIHPEPACKIWLE